MIEIVKQMIVQAIRSVDFEIIPTHTTKPPPPLPYATYNITAPYIQERGHPNITAKERGGELYQYFEVQYLITISFNVYADKNESTIDQTMKLRQWFLFLGQDFLQDSGIAVVSVGNIENRTTFLVDSYEYKYGFDVQLRMTQTTEVKSDWFDKVTFKGE